MEKESITLVRIYKCQVIFALEGGVERPWDATKCDTIVSRKEYDLF